MAGKVNHGVVELQLGDATYELKATIDAMRRIDSNFGSIREAWRQCADMSLDALVSVIAAGAGLTKKGAEDVPEQVFAEGVVRVAAKMPEYMGLLMNPSGREDDGDESGEA